MNETMFPEPFESDLVLVIPPFQRLIVSMENIGIEYIASYVRSKGFTVRMINAGLHGLRTDDIIRMLKRSRFKLLGIATIHWTIEAGLEIAKAIKQCYPDRHIIMGGLEAALNAEDILANYPYIDSVGMSEGEGIVAELLSSIVEGTEKNAIDGLAYQDGNAVVFNPERDLIDPLDALPFPARDDISAVLDSGGPVVISTSRGCWGRCSFCSVRAFYDLSKGQCWRGRSPSSVVEEIRELYDNYGATLFSFIDETVAGPGKDGGNRLVEIATLIRESGLKIDFFMTIRADLVEENLFRELKEAGLRKVEIGIESMAQSQLSRYGKMSSVETNQRALEILGDLDILAETYMIPYDPDVTYDELKQNLSFYAHRFKDFDDRYNVAALTMGDYAYPYPGTQTRAVYKERGYLGPSYYTSFHAQDKAIGKAQQIVHWFIRSVESAFPMSYAGIGNLWINSRDLPAPVHKKICGISARLGELFIELTEWAYRTASKFSSFSADEREAVSSDLRDLLRRASELQEQVKKVIDDHGELDEQEAYEFEDAFTEQLYLFGKERRRVIIEDMYKSSFDDEETISVLTSVFDE